MAGTTAAAGTTGAAGDGAAGTAAAGTNGAAGTAAAGTNGAAGTAAAGTNGAAGDGAAGTAAAGTNGAAGTAPVACANSTVKTAGGSEATCGAKTAWVATALPSPVHRGDIADSALFPKYAIDGMTATRYSSGATMAPGNYFQVDLGVAKMVSGIVVDTSEGTDTLDVANGYDVSLSMDGIDFGTPVATCTSAAAPMETINFTAKMARYVRYTNKGAPMPPANGATSWLSIHEFNILCN